MAKLPQPILPAPVHITEVEASYIEESPPFYWPENQDSNFGLHRKIFSDQVMVAVDQLDLIYNERFIDTSYQFLSEWEEQMGLPQNPAGKTITERRYKVRTRHYKGPFTNAIRRQVVEDAISATFGPAVQLTTLGVPLVSGGVPLYSGLSGPASLYYRITQDVSTFTYTVGIDYRITVDMNWLTQELVRITPAGISFTTYTYIPGLGGSKSSLIGGGVKKVTYIKKGGGKLPLKGGFVESSNVPYVTYPVFGTGIPGTFYAG